MKLTIKFEIEILIKLNWIIRLVYERIASLSILSSLVAQLKPTLESNASEYNPTQAKCLYKYN